MKKSKEKIISLWRLKKPPYLKKADKRYAKHMQEIKEDGFCDAETWSLFTTIAKFTLPRLIRFREIDAGWPGMVLTQDQWRGILDEMIWTFNFIVEEPLESTKQDYNRAEKGLKLFATWFWDLWW